MTDYNRKAQLKQVHRNRKAKTSQKVDEAIKKLVRSNERINFNSVASEAGVAKATLYNNIELHEHIETLRRQQVKSTNSKTD